MNSLQTATILLGLLSLALGTGLGYGGYHYFSLERSYHASQATLASTTEAYQNSLKAVGELGLALRAEEAHTGSITAQVSELASTVGTLDKLAKTDPELLKKYSKVYFLNENYAPIRLSTIDSTFGYPANKEILIHGDVLPHLTALMQTARASSVDLAITSAYRSFSAQASLKTSYKVTYGKGANAFSADQGYSEHQLGTTVDFTTVAGNGTLAGFDRTQAYLWLTDHAHEYGFTLSYPKGNSYYQYEPWHWRYVGVLLASKLHTDGQHFYDLDQRDIDAYLITLFD